MDYDSLVKKVYDLFLGEINEDGMKYYFRKWAVKNNYPLPKMIRLLKGTAYNSEEDKIAIVQEDDSCIYYNDSCHRYCYLNKSEEGTIFEYIKL